MDPPPEPFLGMEFDWPEKKTELATVLTYTCPFRTGTSKQNLKGNEI